MCRKVLLYIFCIATATVASCTNESVRLTPCEEGAFRCNAGNIEVCTDDNWTISENCTKSNKICASQTDGQFVCIDTEIKSCVTKCVDGILTKCNENGSSSSEICSDTNKICGFDNAGLPACVDENVSNPCVTKCVDGILTKCNEDGSSSSEICSDTNKICGFDNAGLPACVEDNSPVFCTVNTRKLFPGNTICDEDGNVVTCNDDGTTSSEPCTRGICASGNCVPRNCGDILDGKTICQNNQLMICSDGTLIEAENACSGETPACRDGENACSAYKNCGNIQHGTTGCFGNNIVSCNDGAISLKTDCVLENKYCASDEANEGQFICKLPTVTDCNYNGRLFRKGETVCDGNVLRTCSKEVNEEFDKGVECTAIDSDAPICDSSINACRARKKCGEDGNIEPEAIVCNPTGSNKAICLDGVLTDLTGEDACKSVEHGTTHCLESESGAVCSVECEYGYVLKDDVCSPRCYYVKELYDVETESCLCDSSKHAKGTAGMCYCEDGYIEVNGICTPISCIARNAKYNEKTGTCTCADDMMYIGDACFEKGDTIGLGHYERNIIEWFVADIDSDNSNALLISKYILGDMPYYIHGRCGEEIYWEDSIIRRAFTPDGPNVNSCGEYSQFCLYNLFTDDERVIIQDIEQEGPEYFWFYEVTILTKGEYQKYVENKIPNTYKNGISGIEWLKGKISTDGMHHDAEDLLGIRPVIWVKYSTTPATKDE